MSLTYYLWASYRRKHLDKLQERHQSIYKGVVLDIGGRDRGRFAKPKGKVERWIFADIEQAHKPDLVLDVTDMKKQVRTATIDVVNAIELFEHVENPEQGLQECSRVLKPGGRLVMSVPFLKEVHADPHDYQRFTDRKWRLLLERAGFTDVRIHITGRFFTTAGDFWRGLVRSLPAGFRHVAYFTYPFVDLIVKLDSTRIVKRHSRLSKYHEGYFIIARR